MSQCIAALQYKSLWWQQLLSQMDPLSLALYIRATLMISIIYGLFYWSFTSWTVALYSSAALLAHIESLAKDSEGTWRQTYPMREDINMYKLPVMTEAHSAISFDKEIQLDTMEEVRFAIGLLHISLFTFHWRSWYYFRHVWYIMSRQHNVSLYIIC